MTDLNAKIIPLHSEVEGRVPTDAQLDVGELSYNITDRKIYTKDTAGNIVVMGAGADDDGGDVDGLPGGGFLPNSDTTTAPFYIFDASFTAGLAPEGKFGAFSGWKIIPAFIDANGVDQESAWKALTVGDPVQVYEGATEIWDLVVKQINVYSDSVYIDLEYPNGDSLPADTLELTDGQAYTFSLDGGVPGVLPLIDGDMLRYDGTNWRPLQHTLENLDNVYKAPGANAPVWTLGPDVTEPLASGAARVDSNYVYLSPIDAYGIDRKADFRRWFDALTGEAQPDGESVFVDGTLTFYKGSLEFPAVYDRIRDDLDDAATGTDDPSISFRCEFRDLYGQTESDVGDLGIREFDAFLGYEQGVAIPVGSTLQYNGTTWIPQLLDFSIEDSNDFALRIDSGSGTELPKTTGDALVWDGTNWVPANVASFLTISDLSDVNTVTNAPTNGQVLTWDETQGYWKPGDAASGGGGDLQGTTESGNTTDQGIFITKANGDAAIDLENTGAVTVRGLLQVKPSTRGEKIRLHSGAAGSVNLGVSGSSAEDIFEYNIEDGNGSHKFSVGSNEVMLLKALNIEAKQKVISPATIADDPGTTLTTKKFVEDLIELATGGGLSGAGALTERADVTVSNAYTDGQSRDEVFIGLGEAGTFVQVTVSNPAWVRFYATAADRTSDSGRQFDIDPLPGSGVLMELKTTQPNQIVKITPAAIYYNNDTLPDQALYARIRNEAGEDTTIAVTVRAYTQTDTDTIDGGSFGSG